MLEEIEQLDAALVLVDAPDVDREAIAQVELLPEAAAVRAFGDLRADADDHAWHRLVLGHALDQRALLVRVVHEGAHAAEHRRIDAEAQRAVALRGRHQDRLRRHRARAMERVVVAEAEEDEEVVIGFVAADVLDEVRAGGTFGIEPRQLIAHRMLLREHSLRPRRELDRIAVADVLEAVHRNAVHHLLAFGQLVLPRNVIAMRARGQHLDLDVFGQVLGDVTRVLLRAAVDVGAVALNDDRDFHCRSSSEPEPEPGSSGSWGS